MGKVDARAAETAGTNMARGLFLRLGSKALSWLCRTADTVLLVLITYRSPLPCASSPSLFPPCPSLGLVGLSIFGV
jgi:hypothetical protein